MIKAIKDKKSNFMALLQQEASKTLGKQDINLDYLRTSPSNLRLSLQQQLIEAANQSKVLQVRKMAITKDIQSIQHEIKKTPVVPHDCS